MKKLRIAVLISGGGSNFVAIDEACRAGKINGEVVLVISDNLEAGGVKKARERGRRILVVDYKGIIKKCKEGTAIVPKDFDPGDVFRKQNLWLPSKVSMEKITLLLGAYAIAEEVMLADLISSNCDLVVLAGFMRFLTPYLIDRINTEPNKPRIMNIHPALLPSFPGEHGYDDTFNYGCKVGGCTVHFVDYGEDSGPIIGQKSYSIEPEEKLDNIKKKGLELEHILYPECIQLFQEGRLKVVQRDGRKIVEIKNNGGGD